MHDNFCNFCPNMKKTLAMDNILAVVADAVVMSTLVTVMVDDSCRIRGGWELEFAMVAGVENCCCIFVNTICGGR